MTCSQSDGSLYTSSKNIEAVEASLQKSLDLTLDWCDSNRMLVHPDKTKCMIIATRQKKTVRHFVIKAFHRAKTNRAGKPAPSTRSDNRPRTKMATTFGKYLKKRFKELIPTFSITTCCGHGIVGTFFLWSHLTAY